MQAKFVQIGKAIDYVPDSAVASGAVVMFGDQPMVAERPIAGGALGALTCDGVFDVLKDDATIVKGNAIYWHTTGTPVGGTATGAANNVAAGGYLMGQALEAAATGATTVRVKLLASVNLLRSAYPDATYGDLLVGGSVQATHAVSATQNYPLATRRVTQDGRVFRYAKAENQVHCGFGAYQDSPVNIAANAPAQAGLGVVGSRQLKVTVGGTSGYAGNGTLAANELAGGHVVLNHQPNGELLLMNRRIVANTAIATTGGVTTITVDEPLTVAVTASTTFIEVIDNPYAHLKGGLTEGNSKVSFLGLPAGKATTGEYFWLQTWGPAWVCPNSNPGLNANDRTVFFQANGTVIGGEDATVEGGCQQAGFIIENSSAGDGPPFIMLQISP